jgi:hypothetical protein
VFETAIPCLAKWKLATCQPICLKIQIEIVPFRAPNAFTGCRFVPLSAVGSRAKRLNIILKKRRSGAYRRADGEEMTKNEQPKGRWIIVGIAVMIGSAAVIVGSTLEAPPSADDNRIFFVIGAGLSTIVLFLIAEVWRFLTIQRRGGATTSAASGRGFRWRLWRRSKNAN